MYNIAVESVNSWNSDGSKVYDRYVPCANFLDVKETLIQKNNILFMGKGSDILDKNDNILFNTSDFSELENDYYMTGIVSNSEICNKIALKDLKRIHAENRGI
jgi:hypothetical protein